MPTLRLLAFLLLLLALAGCRRGSAPPPTPTPQVTVARPVQRDITDFRDFTGRIDAVETVEIRARVKGFLQKIHFKEGVVVVRVPIGKAKPRLLVPEEALGVDQRGRFVLVVAEDGTVEQRLVKTGATVKGLVAVEEGLKAEDRVIVNGVQKARPGAKVEAREETPRAGGSGS